MDHTDRANLIDAPVNAYVLVGTTEEDPQDLITEMNALLGYYDSVLPSLGWKQTDTFPLKLESEEGDPHDIYAEAESWVRGDEAIKISLSNYAPWFDWGYRLR